MKVAYDISFLTGGYLKPGSITGVGRVIRQVASHLDDRPSLDLGIMGSFLDDWNPIHTEAISKLICAEMLLKTASFESALKSRTGLADYLSKVQIRLEAFPRNMATRTIRYLLKKDIKFSLSNQFDAFHATFYAPPRYLLAHVPRIVTIYDLIPLTHRKECSVESFQNIDKILKSLVPSRDVVVAISAFTKSELCRITGFPSHRVVVAPLAVPSSFGPVAYSQVSRDTREFYGIGSGPFIFSLANPQPRKNLRRLVRAFRNMLEFTPSWSGNLVLAGNSGLCPDVQEELKNDPNLACRVLQIGSVKEEDLPLIYSECEFFVFPSLVEGFGLPVLEAMACGAPVVCSDTSSLPEVAGQCAVYFQPTSVESIMGGMLKMFSNSQLRGSLREAGLVRSKMFSWEHTSDKFSQAYSIACEKVPQVKFHKKQFRE